MKGVQFYPPSNPRFIDHPEFTPSFNPREMVECGVFGGSYWRPIQSGVTGRLEQNHHLKYPRLFQGIPENLLTRASEDKAINFYGVKAGSSLADWEAKGWITAYDPYGWFQWYCEFFEGRRIPQEDHRQIDRWLKFAGPKGRFRNSLINECKKKGKSWNDISVSPVKRQGLLHWAYELNEADYNNYLRSKP